MAEPTKTVQQFLEEIEELSREVARLKAAEQERLRMEAELRRASSELELIFRALPDLKFRLSADGTILDYQTGRLLDLYLPPDEFLGKRMQEVLPDPVGEQFDLAICQVRGGEPQEVIEYSLPIQGQKRFFEARLFPLLESQILVIVRDIGPRRRREVMRTARQQVREAVLRMQRPEDLEGVLVAIRDSIEELEIPFYDCGINVVETSGQELVCRSYNLVKNSGWQVTANAAGVGIVARLWRSGEVAYRRDLQAEDRYQEYSLIDLHFGHAIRSVVDIPFSHGTLAFNSVLPNAFSEQDIALVQEMAGMLSEGFQRLEDLQRLEAERERLAVTLRSIGDGVITTDADGRVVLVNAVAEQLTGWRQEEAAGRPLAEVFHIVDERTRQPALNPVTRVLENGQVVGLANSTLLIARDGTERCIADSGAPIRGSQSQILGVVLVFRDVTVARRLGTELVRREKLESVGVLAGGLAHDFNNLLVGILGNVSLARMELGSDTEVHGFLVDAEKAALRARSLTQQLLTFARGGAPVRETASLKELIRESADFALHGSAVQAEYVLAEDLWAAEVDRDQVSQVIQNLVLNAVQAMPEGGLVRLSAVNTVLEEGELPLPGGRYVEIAVADQGVGIAPEYLDRIFDPYFTTKQKGSGLGLTTAYAIVESHGGHLTVTSQLGKGSTFYVYLPAAQASAGEGEEMPAGLVQGQGRVLVMDDEEMVRRLAGRMLVRLGYEPAFAGDGTEALALYRQAQAEGRTFVAVVMDLTIPGGMGGRETIARLLELDPDTRAIVSSGYSNDPIMAEYRVHGFKAVIAKPYTLQGFSQVLQRVVAGQEG